MNFTVSESPWVTLKKGDPSFQLQGPLTLTDRAYIEISLNCPRSIINDIEWAMQKGYIHAVASVPKDDPTLAWETLKR